MADSTDVPKKSYLSLLSPVPHGINGAQASTGGAKSLCAGAEKPNENAKTPNLTGEFNAN